MKITSGVLEVLYTGTIISHKGEPITLYISDSPHEKMMLRFEKIKEDNEERGMRFSLSDDKHTFNITFVNFPAGRTGSKDIIPLGELNNRALFVNYSINNFNINKQWILTVTVYLGEED